MECSNENNDILVSFMAETRGKYTWPNRIDKCWIPLECVLCNIDPPMPSSHGVRYSIISKKDTLEATKLFENFKK